MQAEVWESKQRQAESAKMQVGVQKHQLESVKAQAKVWEGKLEVWKSTSQSVGK
jgi:hypothetical protein